MMEVQIDASSQEEFDEKKEILAKALIGTKPVKPKRAIHRYQNETMDFFDDLFKKYLDKIKLDIGKILDKQ